MRLLFMTLWCGRHNLPTFPSVQLAASLHWSESGAPPKAVRGREDRERFDLAGLWGSYHWKWNGLFFKTFSTLGRMTVEQ